MQTSNINITYQGSSYVGYLFSELPLPAAIQVAVGQIDQAADLARQSIINDPLRALEHERAASEAAAFAEGGYSGDMPPFVAAWADAAGLAPQAAADSILEQAEAWRVVLLAVRTHRLKGKQDVLRAVSHAEVELITDAAIAGIKASVQGVGSVA